jgi:hypothetical protein
MQPTKNTLRPAEVAQSLGRSASWLKLQERRGIIPKATRDEQGRRVYSQNDLEVIRKALVDRKLLGEYQNAMVQAMETVEQMAMIGQLNEMES